VKVSSEVAEEEAPSGLAVRLESNSGKIVLNPLEFTGDIMWCTEETRICVVKTTTDGSWSDAA